MSSSGQNHLDVVPATPRRASLLAAPPAGGPTGLVPGGAGGSGGNKSRARDLLRKHYGLGVGPPPPSRGTSDSADPMDLSESVSGLFGCRDRACS